MLLIAPNHVEVEHGASRGQGAKRVRHIVIRPEHQLFFRPERHEEHAARQALAGEQPGDFDHRHGSRPVVIRSRVGLAVLRPEVVVVRGDQNRFVS